MGRGRVHSREFRLSVVRQVANGERRPAQVSDAEATIGRFIGQPGPIDAVL
jgi:hypothetical protein